MAEEGSGFLGRWSRRKRDAQQGKLLDESVLADKARPEPVAGAAVPSALAPAPAAGPAGKSAAAPDANAPVPEKTLSLEDVKALTQDSDFKPFMARHVGADVRNAALKKLFADPHYNVMDGLDIYIDDYTVADPLPQAMLRQMASAQFLNLFDGQEDDRNKKELQEQGGAPNPHEAAPTAPAAGPNNPNADIVAQSDEFPHGGRPDLFSSEPSRQREPVPGAGASLPDHAHSHLRLQPDHGAPAPNAGRGA